MDIPGTASASPELWERAQEETERLSEELKKSVKADLKDIGVLRKEMRVTVPAEVISGQMEHNFKELMTEAQVPGFRKGRAPRRLVEKRFGGEVRESLVTAIVGQSFYAAAENHKLDVLGDPTFRIETADTAKLVNFDEAMQHLKLPETGDFAYTCEVELKPQFELPELKGIAIKAPQVQVTDEMVNEQIERRRRLRGRFEPVTTPAEKDDQVVADAVLTVDGQEVKRDENITIGVRPSAVDGIPLMELGDVLGGAKPGDTKTVTCTIPPDYERADLRGKSGQFEFKVHEVKRLVPEEMGEFLKAWGFDNEAEVRDYVRGQIEDERDQMMARAKRAQIEDYLLNSTAIDLPAEFSTRQTERAVVRRILDLQRRGVPAADIDARIDELRTSAKEQVARELKLNFVLAKAAEQLTVQVTDEEVNTEIARIAQMYNRRFDRIRDDLQARGLLDDLVEQIRQNKTVDLLLKDAQTSDVPTEADAAPDAT